MFYRTLGPTSLSHIGLSRDKQEALFLSVELHIRYLQSLEDSERSQIRLSCVFEEVVDLFLSREDAFG